MKYSSSIGPCAAVSAVLMAALFLLPLAVVVPFRPQLYAQELLPQETEPSPPPSGISDNRVIIRVLSEGTIRETDLASYLTGVLRAEMPASFELEALKAQAVAARTYTLYKINSGGNHGDAADICTDPGCCQAWLDEAQARENWGGQADSYEAKLREAVTSTDGQAVLYGGVPILAVFHSSSAGLTQPAASVWQNSLPYLQSVVSPETGDTIPNYYSRAEFSLEALRERILEAYPEAKLTGSGEDWLKNAVRDTAGTVETLTVGGISMKGSTLRGILGLRSACFEWDVTGNQFTFYVTGYGHGIGLSQYGANQMALDGADYREILTHYYTDVTVDVWLPAERFTISS